MQVNLVFYARKLERPRCGDVGYEETVSAQRFATILPAKCGAVRTNDFLNALPCLFYYPRSSNIVSNSDRLRIPSSRFICKHTFRRQYYLCGRRKALSVIVHQRSASTYVSYLYTGCAPRRLSCRGIYSWLLPLVEPFAWSGTLINRKKSFSTSGSPLISS